MTSETVENLLTSLVRTVVPVVVGLILAATARDGWDIPPEDLYGVVEAVVVGGYYSLVRLAETKVPQVGWLLGRPLPPNYRVDV